MRTLTSRNRRRTAADERENRRDHEQDDRNKEDDLCDLDRETRDPTKAEDSRNQRNNQKCQSPTKHGGAPSLSKCAQRVLRLRITLFKNDQRAGVFGRVCFWAGVGRASRRLAPPAASAACRASHLGMHVLGEPVGRHLMAEAALLRLAVDEGADGGELIAEA